MNIDAEAIKDIITEMAKEILKNSGNMHAIITYEC